VKKILALLLTIIGGGIMFSADAFASDSDRVPGESVYASRSECNRIYEIVQKSDDFMKILDYDGTHILSETIMPIYVADFLDYAETGVFKIRPDEVFPGINVYYAKTVTAEGLFAGNMKFYIEDGIAHSLGFVPTPASTTSRPPSTRSACSPTT